MWRRASAAVLERDRGERVLWRAPPAFPLSIQPATLVLQPTRGLLVCLGMPKPAGILALADGNTKRRVQVFALGLVAV